MLAYLLILAVAALATYLLVFPTRWLVVRWKLVVPPGERRIHERPLPTAGGVAMAAAFLIAMAVAWRVPHFHNIFKGASAPIGVVLAAVIITAVGFFDDAKEVSAPAKIAGQVFACTPLFFLGITMFYFRIPFAGFMVLSSDLQPLVTVLWVIVIANAVNLIDGLDGLAAGIVAIAAGAFCVYGQRLSGAGLLAPDNIGPLVAAIACGVCIGFLPHNFHPAKIMMGDAGALFLGLLMAVSTSVVGGRIDNPFSGQTYFFFAPVFIPFLILGVPIIDTVFAVFRRAAKRSGVTTADKQHLHHRLMNLGHGQRRSVLILWAWTALLSGFVLAPTFTKSGNEHTANHLIPFGVAALGVALFTLFHPGIRNRTPAAESQPSRPPALVVLEDPTPEEQAEGPFDWAEPQP